jgi:hypothetical protein
MEFPAFSDPEKWLGVIKDLGFEKAIIFMVCLAFCLALGGMVIKGPAWLEVILYHKREMLRIKLKETARKEALNQEVIER